MPIYEFKCEEHGPFEGFSSMKNSQDIKQCPVCSKKSKRYYSRAPSFIMRPEGWNLRPDDKGYDNNFEKRTFTRARYE